MGLSAKPCLDQDLYVNQVAQQAYKLVSITSSEKPLYNFYGIVSTEVAKFLYFMTLGT